MEDQVRLTISTARGQTFCPRDLACFCASWSGISKPWHIWSALLDQIERGFATHKMDTLAIVLEVPANMSMKHIIRDFKGLQTDERDADHGCISPTGIVDVFDQRDRSENLAQAVERDIDNIYVGRMAHEPGRIVEFALIRQGSSTSLARPNIFASRKTITLNLSDELFSVVKGYLSELSTKSSATVLLFAAPAVRHDEPTANRFNDVGDHLQPTFFRQLQGGSMIPAPPTSTARPRAYMLSSKVTSAPGYKHSLGRLGRLASQSQGANNLDEEKSGAHADE